MAEGALWSQWAKPIAFVRAADCEARNRCRMPVVPGRWFSSAIIVDLPGAEAVPRVWRRRTWIQACPVQRNVRPCRHRRGADQQSQGRMERLARRGLARPARVPAGLSPQRRGIGPRRGNAWIALPRISVAPRIRDHDVLHVSRTCTAVAGSRASDSRRRSGNGTGRVRCRRSETIAIQARVVRGHRPARPSPQQRRRFRIEHSRSDDRERIRRIALTSSRRPLSSRP